MVTTNDFLQLLGAASPFLLLLFGWLTKRRIDQVQAAKLAAEARLAEATADKTDAEVQSAIIANTKTLLAEARAVQAEKDAVAAERVAMLMRRVNRMEGRFESLRTALATHGVWDAAALIDLRQAKPDYPPPPPFPRHHGDDDDHLEG